METLVVDEGIRVGVAFDRGRVLPMWFKWKNRYYKISKVHFSWSSSKGNSRLRHFAVSDGSNVYELCFNSHSLEWKLEKITSE